EPEMAGTPAAVGALLDAVWAPAVDRCARDADAIQALMQADGLNDAVRPWDWRYYAERRRRQEHDVDEAEVKPYFALPAVQAAAFDTAARLFGLSFRPIDVPLYHPEAQAFEVTRDGRHLAVFISDYLARPSKRSGAWCASLRRQRRLGADERAIVVNVCNFARPEGDRPALLSWDAARTLFHEFGHALHHILSDVRHPSVSGTSVARDFVELPSQLFEHWLEAPEVLDNHARHVETGAPIPADLRERVLQARMLDTGFETVEYLASAFIDLELHRGPAPDDPAERAASVMAERGLPAAIVPRHDVPHFLHAFASEGYAAGYYSYLWSEVMDADAFDAFREAGDVFDAEVARRLEETILSKGGAGDPAALYRAFRGRAPGIGPLLAGRGLSGG
ncbi:MAG: peptidase M3, partial [Alphaproteobacteria bacterium]